MGRALPCPPKVAWNATIRVVGKGTVTYSLAEIGGAAATEGTVSFQDRNFRSVPITLTVKGSSGEHIKRDVSLTIISPPDTEGSWGSHYDLFCE